MIKKIKKHYRDYERDLISGGKFAAGETSHGYYAVSVLDDVEQALTSLNLPKEHSFIDIGSGDGRIACLASQFFDNATGVEGDASLSDFAIKTKKKLNLPVSFATENFMGTDLRDYDVIFINPDKSFDKELERKLKTEFKGTLMVYSFKYFPKKEHEKEIQFAGYRLRTYRY